VGAGEKRFPSAALVGKDRHQVVLGRRIDARHRLIQEVDVGLLGQRPSDEGPSLVDALAVVLDPRLRTS
jgi:hypothetical protein